MRVLFCFYPLFVHYNHGVALLSALCRERGIETELCMLGDLNRFWWQLHEGLYDYICFSAVVERDYQASLPFMRMAKEEFGYPVILGGVYPRRGLDLPGCPADLVCRGEGETLPDFFLHGDDRLFREKLVWDDLNELPLPDYELFEQIPFDRDMPWFRGKKVLPYYSSRGCAWPCSFCEVRFQTGKVRYRHQVGTDLRHLQERYAPDLFFLGDETLPYWNPIWRDSWGDFRHPFVAYIRADIRAEQLEFLADRGMVGCAFGVESGDENHRNQVLNKKLTDQALFRTVEQLQRLGVEYSPFFMTGTPGETFRVRAATEKMAREIGGYPVIFQYEDLGKEKKTWDSPQLQQ